WTVVVYRGDFKVGQLVLYFEIDSFIPATNGRFSWEVSDTLTEFRGEKGYHVRSQMLGKQLSQGLVQQVGAMPEVNAVLEGLQKKHGVCKGTEMAMEMAFEDRIGVKKWEVPFEVQGQILGPAPSFFPRPASERVQNIPDLFTHRYLNEVFQVTEKLDGVSMTVYSVVRGSKWYKALPAVPVGPGQETQDVRFGVASANKGLDERGNDLYWNAAKRLGLPTRLHGIGGVQNVAIQGELVGPAIKRNSMRFPDSAEHNFFVFQIFDIDKQEYLPPVEVVDICERMALPHVPVLGYFKLRDFAASLNEILAKAEGVGTWGQTREGYVFKSVSSRKDFTFKVISNKWL
ncbi:DNA ligase/mRNA capping enzyme, partial [Cryphonectria parasitica EP155]